MGIYLAWLTGILIASVVAYLGYKALKEPIPESIPDNAVYEDEVYLFDDEITVDLMQCSLIENTYYKNKEDDMYYDRRQGPMILFNRRLYEPPEQVEVKSFYIEYKTNYDSVPTRFVSQSIHKDRATILFLMEAKKHPTIRLNSSNPKEYYFNINFLLE